MQCTNPVFLKHLDMDVPCGKCLGCLMAYRRMWSARMVHEAEYWNDAIFVTLTYNDESVPRAYLTGRLTLRKEDLQKFFKRLRRKLDFESFGPSVRVRKIRYYACGEYGNKEEYRPGKIGSERPHYHMIIFGMDASNNDRKIIAECWPYADWNNPSIWSSAVKPASKKRMAYVAKYVNKRFYGQKRIEEYAFTGRHYPFKLSSNGLGARYAMDDRVRILQSGSIPFDGAPISVPRYYLKVNKIYGCELPTHGKKDDRLNELIADIRRCKPEEVSSIDRKFSHHGGNEMKAEIRKRRDQRERTYQAKIDLSES